MDASDNERWLPVVGWELLYVVSDQGRVRSLPRTYVYRHWRDGSQHSRKHLGRMLRLLPSTVRYPQVCLSQNAQVKRVFVHRLVAEAFIANPSNLPIINHLNGVREDPRAVNLEWTDYTGNAIHALETGLRMRTPTKCAEAAVRATHARLGKPSLNLLASALGVDWSTANAYAKRYGLAVQKRKAPTYRDATRAPEK